VAKKAPVALPIAPLSDLMRWWAEQNVNGVIIGGLAVALLGRPRITRDIDALILLPEQRWSDFTDSGSKFGFLPRYADTMAMAREGRILLFHHASSAIEVDISLGCLPFEEEILARHNVVKIGKVSVPLPTPEDLVIMKAVAHREQDLLDIEGLLAAHPHLEKRRVRRWVKAFANALEAPELYEDLQRLLKVRPRGRKH
jgi:hypothetical protein